MTVDRLAANVACAIVWSCIGAYVDGWRGVALTLGGWMVGMVIYASLPRWWRA